MIFEKVFETTIFVINPINFCINKRQHVLKELNNNYLYKCYLGAFILEILDILQMSSCKIISSNSSGHGTIDIKFLAKIYVLNAWDILIGINIEKNQSLLVGKYKKNNLNIDIIFKPTHIQSSNINIKQLLPVRIIETYHKPKSNQITASGILLTCDRKSIFYKVRGEVSRNTYEKLNIILFKIKEELIHRNELMITKKNEILFFEKLLYSYKNNIDEKTINVVDDITYTGLIPNDDNLKNIFNIINIDLTGYWCRPLNISKSSPLILFTNDKPEEYVIANPYILLMDIAKNILNYLIAIREFIEVYNTKELIASHENIWNMMRQAQL